MDHLEKVEKIREKTGVSYEDAKAALEANGYDVLDAIVYLEKQGKVPQPKISSYSTGQEQQSDAFSQAQQTYKKDCQKKSTGDLLGRFCRFCVRLLKKSCDTTFEITRNDNQVASLPVLLLILCAIFAFWVTLPLLIVGLFFGCRYQFRGFESTSIDINDVCDKASEACENIKQDFQNQNTENNEQK